MEAFVLKILIHLSIICFHIITFSECTPLIKERMSILPDWTSYNSFEPEGPGTYSFGYDIEDPEQDNVQFRDEERHADGTVKGSYGYLTPDGMIHMVHYTADKAGYRARFENYPRGQLKPLIKPNLLPEESELSSALAAAVQSEAVYKKQRVHEQHLRPIDAIPPKDLGIQTPALNDNTNGFSNKKPGGYLNNRYTNSIYSQHMPSLRLFLNRYKV